MDEKEALMKITNELGEMLGNLLEIDEILRDMHEDQENPPSRRFCSIAGMLQPLKGHVGSIHFALMNSIAAESQQKPKEVKPPDTDRWKQYRDEHN